MAKVFSSDKLLYQIALNGTTGAKTADKAGLHRNTVQYLINGRNKGATRLTLFKLAIALNCSPDDFLVDEPEAPETGKE